MLTESGTVGSYVETPKAVVALSTLLKILLRMKGLDEPVANRRICRNTTD